MNIMLVSVTERRARLACRAVGAKNIMSQFIGGDRLLPGGRSYRVVLGIIGGTGWLSFEVPPVIPVDWVLIACSSSGGGVSWDLSGGESGDLDPIESLRHE